MPRKTDGEKIDELEKLVAALEERLANTRQTLEDVRDLLRSLTEEVAELKMRLALMEQQVAMLKQGQEKWGQRLWLLLAPLAGAVVGSLLTYYLRSGK